MKSRAHRINQLLKIIFFTALIIHSNLFKALAAEEDFVITLQNICTNGSNVLEFEIFVLDTDPSQNLEMCTFQAGINFNSEILNGGEITYGMTTIVPGSSDLPSNMAPISISTIDLSNSTYDLIRIAARAAPGCGAGYIISKVAPGTRIAKIRFTNSVPLAANSTPDFSFTSNTVSNPLYPTRFSYYEAATCIHPMATIIPGVNANVSENGVTICLVEPPMIFDISGGGLYCIGGSGLSIHLSGSETGVSYQLLIGTVPQGNPISGTGATISFDNQTNVGTYTIIATREIDGITSIMNGSAMIDIYPELIAGLISQDQTISYNEIPTLLSATAPSGGDENYNFQWESSIDSGITWIMIPNETNLTFQPGALIQTTMYRLQQVSGGSCGYVYTNSLTITVVPFITNSVAGYLEGIYYQLNTPATSYLVTAHNLTDNLEINASTNWSNPEECQLAVSLSPENEFSSQIVVSPIGGIIDTTIYVRPSCDITPFNLQGIISNSSPGAITDVINVQLVNDYSFQLAPIVDIGDIESVPGSTVHIPFTALSDFNVCVGRYYIDFDPAVLTFIGVVNAYDNLEVCNNCLNRYGCDDFVTCQINTMATFIDSTSSSLLISIYYSETGGIYEPVLVCPAGEKFFDLEFLYHGGISNLTFTDGQFSYACNCGQPYCNPEIIDSPAEEFYLNGSVSSLPPITTNLELNLEGLYNPAIGEMRQARGRTFPAEVADEITVSIAQSTFPYSFEFEVDSVELTRNGHCSVEVPGNLNGEYYIVISHRNSIQTWSKYPVSFNQDTINYVFSDNIQKAYNNNLKLVTDKYCIYAGDINQDGFVDSADMTILDNESNQFVMGYNPSDINGDVFTDSGDIVMADNNIYTFTSAYQPGSGVPEVSTAIIHDITSTSAVSGGEVITQGTSPVLVRGICWNTSPNPTTANSTSENGSGAGVFTSTMTNLQPNITYYVRAFATNSETTAYGYQLSFKTEIAIPFLSTAEISEITGSSAVSGGTILTDGGASITQRGVCWSTSPEPEITDNITNDGTGSGVFVSNLSGLNPNTTYYLRAYATNSAGTGYGNELEFTTPANLAELTTETATNITSNSATSGGTITNDGGAMITAHGVCYSQNPNPTIANDTTLNGVGSGNFISQLTGLLPNVMYYVRAYATNLAGTSYGNEVSFTTNAELPSLSTESITSITGTTAISGGIVTGNGGATITQRGICWNTASNPTLSNQFTSNGSGLGSFISYLTGLNLNTTYYVRSYAINSAGTAYGNEVSFTTALFITGNGVTDIQGNTYSSIILGTQEWMGENLKVALYNNGDSIQQIFTNTVWSGLSTGAWCWMNNDNLLENPYGKLYNYYAVTDSRNVCPAGWRMPTDAEWTILTNYLGGTTVAGGKMKSTGITFWNSPNTGATNASNFSGLPGGYRTDNGTFGNLGSNGIWWSSTELNTSIAWYRSLLYNSGSSVRSNNQKKYGFSVRCIREISLSTVTTTEAINISRTTANSGGNITDAGGTNILEKGVCWSTSQNPTINDSHTSDGNSPGEFNSTLNNLIPYTTYYLKAYATNQAGTAYGNEVVFTTTIYSQGNGLTDIDGNNYTSVIIGEQEWMAQHLKTSKYRNGDAIPNVADNWYGLTTGVYCWTFNNEAYDIYGKLYNWYAVADNRELCNDGWHIPDETEWDILINHLGGVNQATAAKMIKMTECVDANNGSGFSAVLSNYRESYDWGGYDYSKDLFWSSSEVDSSIVRSILLGCAPWGSGISIGSTYKNYGISVRCLKDDLPQFSAYVITNPAYNISTVSASIKGEVVVEGGSPITARGFCWSTNQNPTISNNHSYAGSGIGIFICNLTELNPNTTYYVRAYATSSLEITYGAEVNFTTLAPITCTSFTLTHIAGSVAPVTKTVTYNVVASGLSGENKCWITQNLGADHQATAENDATEASAGWYWQFNRFSGYKHDGLSLTPDEELSYPIMENYNWLPEKDPCSLLLGSSWRLPTNSEWQNVLVNGVLNNSNDAYNSTLKLHTSGLLYPMTNDIYDRGTMGFYWSSSQYFDMDSNAEAVLFDNESFIMTVGTKSTGASLRCVSNGTTNEPTLPKVVTDWFNSSTGEGGGDATNDGGAFITAKGVCWSTMNNPTLSDNFSTDGSGPGPFVSSITELVPSTQYFIRAYATNSVGTSYGNEIIIYTPFVCGYPITINHLSGSISPVDKTATYGTIETNLTGSNKCWITQNLGADHQANSATDNTEASSGWYWQFNRKQGYKHDGTTRTPNSSWISSINENSNWTSSNDPCYLLFRNGWRIPTATEWSNADMNGGWDNYAETFGSDLKLHLSGALVFDAGSLIDRGIRGYYWSSTQNTSISGNRLHFGIDYSGMHNTGSKTYSYPVRCIKD